MPISADTPTFPNNVVDVVATRIELLDSDLTGAVLKRPLRTTDPNIAVGVHATLWRPDEDSIEFRGDGFASPGPQEPTIQRFTHSIQCMVKDTDEERGLYTHAVLSKMVRSMLYHDDPLRVTLAALSVTMSGTTESSKRWGLGQTRYLSNEIRGNWIYLSTLDFWLETETG